MQAAGKRRQARAHFYRWQRPCFVFFDLRNALLAQFSFKYKAASVSSAYGMANSFDYSRGYKQLPCASNPSCTIPVRAGCVADKALVAVVGVTRGSRAAAHQQLGAAGSCSGLRLLVGSRTALDGTHIHTTAQACPSDTLASAVTNHFYVQYFSLGFFGSLPLAVPIPCPCLLLSRGLRDDTVYHQTLLCMRKRYIAGCRQRTPESRIKTDTPLPISPG